ncbi:hypothetical protein CVT25_009887 [Psilocybe cyanescens]|uniref:Bromo domain-containing protein n=1 Tax=Psilocybe cyanescens TaxID=93625 RepID=A0A409XT84_PSICY|nr:hypothetical protein CVT25_009887 [Psilocybe cyanescens]
MSTRSTRRLPVLNNIESLLLAQSVWNLGANKSTWSPIAKILSKHPLLSRPKSFFTAQSCLSMYETLMKDAGLEQNESTSVPHGQSLAFRVIPIDSIPAAGVNLQLAQKHYRSRFLELQGLILNEESKFKTVLKEIEDIRAGLWDKQDPDSKTKTRAESPAQPQSSPPQTQITDEIFSGSDLSGVTESADSAPSHSQPENETSGSPIQAHQDVQMEDTTPSTAKSDNLEKQTVDKARSRSPTLQHQAKDIPDEAAEEITITPNSDQAATETTPTTEIISKSDRPSPSITTKEECASAETLDKHDQLEDHKLMEVTRAVEDEDMSSHSECVVQRQEEEEEEVTQEEKNEEEEEEASQGREESEMAEERPKYQNEKDEDNVSQKEEEITGPPEDAVIVDTDQNVEEEPSSPKSVQDNEADSDLEPEPLHFPVAETIDSEVDPTPDDGQSSEMEEPVAPARRSSRRRKSSAAPVPPLQTRTRLRSKARASETELHAAPAIDSDNDGDPEAKEDTPQMEEERASSPFDGAMTRRRDGKRKASFLESAGSPHDKKRLREDSEPVDEEEPGPSSHNPRARITRHATRTEEQVAMKRFQSVIGMLHSQISQHRNGNIFHNPIKNSEAPDYHEIVKRPMDLKTIKTRVKDGVIANSLEFQRDIYLMFANAMMYNRPGSDVHAMAEDMMLESEGQINAFRQTEGLVKRGQRP